jgi:uncharacterized protein (DUF302 family)
VLKFAESSYRGTHLKHITTATGDVNATVERLTAALLARKFGVMHVHDLTKTLNSKGVPFAPECRVLEVCNPQQAAKVLTDDIDMNMALPCRISVYEKNGKTLIGMLSPKAMLVALSDSPALAKVADEVESVLKAAIAEAAGSR